MLREMPIKLKLLLLSMIVANIGTEIFMPFIALYARELGAGPAEVGLFFTIWAIGPIFFRILGGWISDSAGRLWTVALGSIVGCTAFASFGLARSWTGMIPGAILMSLGTSLVGPSFSAFTAESSPKEARGRIFGVIHGLYQVCAIVGPPIGGLIIAYRGYRMLFVAAVTCIAAATGIRFINARGAEFKTGELKVAKLKSSLGGLTLLALSGGVITWMFVIDAFLDFAFGMSFQFFALFQNEVGRLSEPQIGLLGSLGAVTVAVAMMVAGRISDRVGENRCIALGAGLAAGAMVALVSARSLGGFALAAVLNGLSQSFFGPAYESLMSKAVPPDKLGLTYGVFDTTLSLLGMPAPWVGGKLWRGVSPRAPFVITALVSGISTVPIWLKLKAPAAPAEIVEPVIPHLEPAAETRS